MHLIPLDDLRSRPASNARRQLPPWFKIRLHSGPDYQDVRAIVSRLGLHTICEEARCPNIWECWNRRTATFLILGAICMRRCRYCAVATGRPRAVDPEEPLRVAQAVRAMQLRHAVITSVNRDDLEDGGASMFAETMRQIRRLVPACTIEVLIPDFDGSETALRTVAAERPDILNHNIETVERLFPVIRPQGKYRRSLELLARAKRMGLTTKSGLIIGMGETAEEIRQVMHDLRTAGCDILTIGQYLQPTKAHLPVARFYHPDDFERFKAEGLAFGFRYVEAGPLVRSSYHASTHVSV